MKNQTIILLLSLFICAQAHAQIIYFWTDGPPYPPGFWKFDINTCTICAAFSPDIAFTQNNDHPFAALILPDGDILTIRSFGAAGPPGGLLRFDPPNPTATDYIPGPIFFGGCVAPNGTVYLSTGSGLYTFNPADNTYTLIGNYPAGQQVMINIFFYNGQLYGFCCPAGATRTIVQINTSNPGASTVVGTTWIGFASTVTASNGTVYGYNGAVGNYPYGFYSMQVPSGVLTPICNPGIPLGSGPTAMMAAPPGTPDLPCLCTATNSTPAVTQVNACVPSSVTVQFNGNPGPDFNDVVRYILYTDPANPMGSILQIKTTPFFTYSAPIQPNVNYYVAQIIGNPLNGNVDPNDPCLAISTAVTVIWRPKPTVVSLTTPSGNLCGGACGTVELTLSGTPPFAYSWQVQQGGNVLTPLQTVFNSYVNPATFQACVPPGTTGAVNVVICGLLDAYCPNP
ncbi:MAG: hypothetical protein WCR52_08925 [Bacteroidota bacterium]